MGQIQQFVKRNTAFEQKQAMSSKDNLKQPKHSIKKETMKNNGPKHGKDEENNDYQTKNKIKSELKEIKENDENLGSSVLKYQIENDSQN